MKLDDLQPSVRMYNILSRGGYSDVSELPNLSDDKFLTISGSSKSMLAELHDLIERYKEEVGTKFHACRHCSIATYTDKPFKVVTQMGNEVYVTFNFCPVCGRDLRKRSNENIMDDFELM